MANLYAQQGSPICIDLKDYRKENKSDINTSGNNQTTMVAFVPCT